MNQTLDLLELSIRLMPPKDAPSEALAIVELHCDKLGLTHAGDFLTDPLTPQEREELRWYLEEYWKWPYYEFAERAKQIEALLPQIGKRLYEKVFEKAGAIKILEAWRLHPAAQRQIRIISNIPRALSLPWELLHDEQGFLALRARRPVAILRSFQQRELAELTTSFEPPLRILLVTARPEGTDFIDPRGLARELLEEVQKHVEEGTLAVEFLRPPTIEALGTRLQDTKRPVQILHFDGHGVFKEESDPHDEQRKQGGEQGMLEFEDADGNLDLVKAEDLAQVLQDSGVKLAVLDACQSAMSSVDDAFSSVAARLIQAGIDATVAMSASVLVTSSTRFFEAFYRELVVGTPAPIAQQRARQALYFNPKRHIFRPRPDEEGQPVELRDWWLPHFYQQRPLALKSTTKPKRKQKQATASNSFVRLNTEMPPEPRYGFNGRSYELLQIERFLLRGKLVVISGFGGVGKTALVREVADWLTRTGMYDGACFVSFEHGGDASILLSALGTSLGVYDGNYNPNAPMAALEGLKPALKKRSTLVIADNMESILPGGQAPLEAGALGQLWDVLLELAKMHAGVLLTTRDTNFGDGRLAQGKRVAYLRLGGLYREDAYTLATCLLTDLDIPRTRAPYADLRNLLAELDYHPLSIQLVLPALSTTPLATIHANFSLLLPKFVDDHETGRNRSLLASLDYSLRRLSVAQNLLLPRLALFEGGANEDNLLAITEIPKTEWMKLRSALEQAALLSAEQVHEAITFPFLHFHPVLTPYLRSQPGADDAALRKRYKQHYLELARFLYFQEDKRNPQAARALVQRELPNLRRALALLLEDGEVVAATVMESCIVGFLDFFGRRRELEDLRRWVEEAVAKQSKTQEGGALTPAEYLRESSLGEDELAQGNLPAAFNRFTRLLERIETQPAGAPFGRDSSEHCDTLHQLARCLTDGGQPIAAEARLRETLPIIEVLLKEQPEDKSHIHRRGTVLTALGDALREQRKYPEGKQVYEEALNIFEDLGDVRNRAVVQGQLGTLAQLQGDYAQARSLHSSARAIFHQALNEPGMEAVAWDQLGRVAQDQKDWTEAERCYRTSLALWEQLGSLAGPNGTSTICNQLALVAQSTGRPSEAEGWYKRALELDEQVQPDSSWHATHLSNLARLLTNEVRAYHAPTTRLTEARGYAERALTIRESLDASSESWVTLSILADITEMEGRIEEARAYRRREQEAYAAFAGNRDDIDRQYGHLIAAIAAVATGDKQAREVVEAHLSQLEASGIHIAAAIRRIWAGEREWHALVEDLDYQDALLVLRVLETLRQGTQEE